MAARSATSTPPAAVERRGLDGEQGGTSWSREAGPSQRIGRSTESQQGRTLATSAGRRDIAFTGKSLYRALCEGFARDPIASSRPENIRAKARAREITLHSAILASALWAAVGADVISPGPLGRYSGFQKGNDFVSFYVSGSLARDGNFASLVDATRFHTAQIPFLPRGDTAFFPPLYGPQLALFFSPIARLPYLAAYAVWATITLALTFWSVSVLRRHVPSLAGYRWPVAMATAAYPPLAYLVLDGQISVLALVALSAAVVAISRGFHATGGAMIGLLGYKVSLVGPAIAVCVLAGEWTLAAAAFAVATLQLILTVPIVGLDVVTGFLSNMASFARSPDTIVDVVRS